MAYHGLRNMNMSLTFFMDGTIDGWTIDCIYIDRYQMITLLPSIPSRVFVCFFFLSSSILRTSSFPSPHLSVLSFSRTLFISLFTCQTLWARPSLLRGEIQPLVLPYFWYKEIESQAVYSPRHLLAERRGCGGPYIFCLHNVVIAVLS